MEIHNEIERQLTRIEEDRGVRILFACESGSRAWGFPSANSDYDVRFIYVNPRDWYLVIRRKRDVIELPIEDDLDINGWDLRKALFLLYKSNPTLQEWLSSPIVYREEPGCLAPMRELTEHAFSQPAACHHYLSMAKLHVSRYFDSPLIRLKAYLYTIRPLLSCRWALEHGTQPPMLFGDLCDEFLPDGPVRSEIEDLLVLKRSADEVKAVKPNPVLTEYCRDEYARLSKVTPPSRKRKDTERFNAAFREMLELSWN